MYAAFALGAPAGAALYGPFGFTAIALITTVIPLLTLAIVVRLQRVAPTARVRASFLKVVSAVSLPGIGLAFASVGFGAITAFISLLFAARGWPVWSGFTVFATAFIAARVLFGHLADRVGGAKIALGCVLIEAAGQAFIWLAPSSAIALIGAALTGFGYSLVYPGLGVEAVRRAPSDNRGLAMGAYTASWMSRSVSPVLRWASSRVGAGWVQSLQRAPLWCCAQQQSQCNLLPRRTGLGRSVVRCAP